MSVFHTVFWALHLAAGVAALFLFWVPALTKKGSPVHRRAGRWYAAAMLTVLVTAVVLAGQFLLQGRVVFGAFLLFLGVITGTSLWNGWRVLRLKREPARYAGRTQRFVGALNVVGGATVMAVGWAPAAPLLLDFGPVGFLIGGPMLLARGRAADDPRWWLREHLTGMIGSGIAAHVAFLVFGGRQLLGLQVGGAGVLLWVVPLVAGTLAIIALNVHYRGGNAMRPMPS
jgi:hypothetical protein